MRPLRTARDGLRRAFAGTVRDRIFFLHLPKCGGTAVDAALRNSLGGVRPHLPGRSFRLDPAAAIRGAELADEPVEAFRERLLLYHLASSRCRYVSGHFTWSERAFREFGQAWRFVTLLRHPVSRWLSWYFYNRYKASDHFRIDCDLEAFVESERGRRYGRSFVLALTDGIDEAEAGSERAVRQAIANLERFSLVGVLERLDAFAEAYRSAFGAPLFLERRNESPVPEAVRRQAVGETIRRRVETLCEPDLRVYEAVLARLSAAPRRAALPPVA